MTSAPRQLDCFTIALGKKTGTTFPITFDNKHNYNALYDTGAGASLTNYSAYVSLGQDLDTGYQPFVKNASGEDMGALGQVTCTFTINDQPFTQSFIVREIWLIRSNFPGFSVDGQRSETSELNMD